MKKESLSIKIVKTLLVVVIFTGLGTIIIGGAYLFKTPKKNLPIANPVIETQCKIDSDCALAYSGSNMCLPCDISIEEYECLPLKEAQKIEKERSERMVNLNIFCERCLEKPQHTCECENGKCRKVKEELFKKINIITDKIEYNQGEKVKITIKNNSDKEQKMDFPVYTIERFENEDWIKVRNIQCPCGADCNIDGPIFIKSKGKLEYKWDQQESWCDGNIMSLSKKNSKQVSAGIYRVKSIKRNMDGVNDDQPIYSNEFTIKENSALDVRCGEKVVGADCEAPIDVVVCQGLECGYEFNSTTGKCIEKIIPCYCRPVEIPFKTLEECQEVCEKVNLSCPMACSKILPSVNAMEISSLELSDGMYYGNLNQKKKSTPANWIHILEGTRSSSWRSQESDKNYVCDCDKK